jgi:lipopolysaccharide export system protein LptC
VAERRITGDYGFSRTNHDAGNRSLMSGITRYTCFVKLSKVSLLVLLGLLFAVVMLLPVLEQDRAGVRVAFSSVKESLSTIDKPIMKHPRYQGVDEKMQPYVVTADEAVQQDDRTVVLSNVMADMRFADASWVMMSAGHGEMDVVAKTVVLRDRISFNHDAGYEFYANKVRVDLVKGTAYSDEQVEGQSPMGYLRADGFEASRNDKRLLLQGHVKLVIQPQKVKK